MKNNKKVFMMLAILLTAIILIFIAFERGTELLKGLDLFIFIAIILIGIIALFIAYKKDKEIKEGQPADDELSEKIKYKAGYYSFLYSMYMWLFIFILRDKFPNVETMIGGGILISALISFITKYIVKQKIND